MSATTDPSRTDWPTAGTLAVLTAALTFAVGPIGAVAGLATGLTWYAVGTPYAVATGHVLLASGLPARIDLATVALVELAFLAFVAAGFAATDGGRRPAPRRDVGVLLAGAAGLVGVARFGAASRPLWIAAVTLLAVFAFAAYALHRYELVRLGLVPDDPSTDPDT